MKSVAIITARGGSKRIPRKNIRLFCGKPIIAYSIEVALSSNLFDEVMVSTDDEEIAKVAKSYGAVVPFMRSAAASNDFASTVDVLVEVLETYKTKAQLFDYACCIYPTAALMTTQRLQEGFKLMMENRYDTVFTVQRFRYPIQRALKVNPAGGISMFWPENLNKRSQDLPPAFHDAGQFYWFDTVSFEQNKTLWTQHSRVMELAENEAQDIDDLEDCRLAELKYKCK